MTRVSSPSLVGRRAEMEHLERELDRAQAGQPAVVLVAGEAGMGKTRLLREVVETTACPPSRLLLGGCIPLGSGVPYAPIAEALRALVRELGPEQVRWLAGPCSSELAVLVPELAPAEAASEAGEVEAGTAQIRLFEAFLALLGRVSEDGLALFLVEDLHWADRATLDLVAFVVRNLRHEAAAVVLTYRDDELHKAHPLRAWIGELRRLDSVSALELPRLDRHATTDQLAGILGVPPAPDLTEAIYDRSEGNPFFTEELLAFLGTADAGPLPPTLRDLPMTKVQSLSPAAQEVLRLAAAAGRRVGHDLLAGLATMSHGELDAALREALDRQVIVLGPSGDTYAFRHALIQEAVYSELLPGERRRIHAVLARTLTDRPELGASDRGRAPAEIAHHWYAAQVLPEALASAVVAAAAAEELHAHAEVLKHLSRVIEVWDRVPEAAAAAGADLAAVYQRAAAAADRGGEYERAAELAEAALRVVDDRTDPLRAGLLYERLGSYHLSRGEQQAASDALGRAVDLIPTDPPSPARAGALASAGTLAMLCSRYLEADALGREALAVAHQAGAVREEVRSLGVLGVVASHRGQAQEGTDLLRQAVDLAWTATDGDSLARSYINLGHVLGLAGRLEEAAQASVEGYEAARELGMERQGGTYLRCNAAWALFKLGRWDEARRHWRQAATAGMRGTREISLLLACAELDIAEGNFGTARGRLERACAVVGQGWAPLFYRRELAEQRLELAIWEGVVDEARSVLDDGLGLVTGTEDEPFGAKLLALGLRLEADRAELARARRHPEELRAAGARGQALHDRARDLASALATPVGAGLPENQVQVAVAEAEWARLEGNPDAEQWAEVARRWDELGRPYPSAYARWREGEARLAARGGRARAAEVVQAAHAVALHLGAEPLRWEIELLAKRGRVDLEQPSTSAGDGPASPGSDLGLTPRELEVLAELAAGRSNAQIAASLFISVKTASVHVSHLLTKLGVSSRGEAAALAHRLGLFTASD